MSLTRPSEGRNGRLGAGRSSPSWDRLLRLWHFYKGQVLGLKLFKLLPPCHLVRSQRFEKIDDKVFQVDDPNPRSKRLKRTSPDDRLLLRQATVRLWEEEHDNPPLPSDDLL